MPTLVERSEHKTVNISYNGEFGPELQIVVPYAYYLFKKGLLGRTESCLDTKCMYYFSQDHEEKYQSRRYCNKGDPMSKQFPNRTEHKFRLDVSKYMPPPYKEVYSNSLFVWDKEPLVILNKYNSEWHNETYNYIDLSILKDMLELLSKRYQVIYCRALGTDIIVDHNDIKSYGDFELLTNFPGVLTIQDLHRSNSNLSFNTLQFMVFANCNKFISVQGGNSALASYFAKTNIIYAKKGRELIYGDFNNYHLFNGAKVCPCLNYRDFLDCIRKIYCNRKVSSFSAKHSFSMAILIQLFKYNLGVLIAMIKKINPSNIWRLIRLILRKDRV